jgi:hypothetical protein
MQYASFMLRLQWTQNDNCPAWVVSIQSTKTGKLRRFSNLDAFIHFLVEEFSDSTQTLGAMSTTLPEEDLQTSGSPDADTASVECLKKEGSQRFN